MRISLPGLMLLRRLRRRSGLTRGVSDLLWRRIVLTIMCRFTCMGRLSLLHRVVVLEAGLWLILK